jgi:ubiquinone/menaquinone biosynthesis C-methylase UbiE
VSEWKQKRSVMRRYDLTAHLYDARYAEEQEAKYKIALENVKITGNSLILDVGCGTGLLFSHVAAEAEAVVGVDVSGGVLLQAREHAQNFRSVHLVQADADRLPFRNACFSVVFAFTVLQNMPKPSETLMEIRRTAMHDAFVVVTGLKKAFSLEAFGALLREAGLRAVSLRDDGFLECYVAVCRRGS